MDTNKYNKNGSSIRHQQSPKVAIQEASTCVDGATQFNSFAPQTPGGSVVGNMMSPSNLNVRKSQLTTTSIISTSSVQNLRPHNPSNSLADQAIPNGSTKLNTTVWNSKNNG